MENKTFAVPPKSFLFFEINKELFAIDTNSALESLSFTKITKVPRTSKFIKGIVNYRGDILPIVDLHQKLFTSITAPEHSNVIVIQIDVDNKHQKIGFLVDKVKGVIDVSPSKIQPVPDMQCAFDLAYTQGMFEHNSSYILIFNIEQLFSIQEFIN